MKRVLSLLSLLLLVSACAPVAGAAPIPVIQEATGTPSPIPTLTFTPTSTFTPTALPTFTPTLDPIRRTPPTLMLHRPNPQFDSLAFLKDFVKILQENNMKVVTYRYIHDHPDITATEQGKLFVITIDDIFLAYPITKPVLEMIHVLRDADYPAVLGIVTETEHVDPQNAALINELIASGWEAATHTDTHFNLGRAERASSTLVSREVTISMDKIEKATGVRPITLILPEGNMVNKVKPIQDANIYWIAGIGDGNTYDVRSPIVYVGREGPYTNAERTFKLMKERFGF